MRASVALSKWANEDPRGLHAWLESQLRANGMIQAPQSPQAREPQGDGRPQPDYVDPTTGLKVYSAERADALARWYAEQAMARLEQRIAPIEQRIGSADVQQRAHAEATRIYQDAVKNWEGFAEFQTQIFAEMQKDKRLSVEGAYRRIVLPQLKDRHRQELLKELEQKSGASTESPAAQRPVSVDTTKRSLKENFRAEFRRRGWSS